MFTMAQSVYVNARLQLYATNPVGYTNRRWCSLLDQMSAANAKMSDEEWLYAMIRYGQIMRSVNSV